MTAQDASVASLGGTLALRGAIDASRSHGCSQSHESISRRTELALDVDARGAASLTVERDERTVLGPSLGRFRAGDRDFSEIVRRARAVMRGRAVRTTEGIEIRFVEVERASIEFQGPGTLPLPAAVRSPLSATLRCRVQRTEVLPAEPSTTRPASSLPLLACAWDVGASVPPLAPEDPPMLLGSGRGVVVESRDPDFAPEVVVVRLRR